MTPEERVVSRSISSFNSPAGLFRIVHRPTSLLALASPSVRLYVLITGEADYLLFAAGKAIATVEAKPEGYTLTGVEGQPGRYAKGLFDIYPSWGDPLPFAYESTGSETRFTNRLDPNPASRGVFAFYRPETLIEWVSQPAQLNERLRGLPPLITGHLLGTPKRRIRNTLILGQSRGVRLDLIRTGLGHNYVLFSLVIPTDVRNPIWRSCDSTCSSACNIWAILIRSILPL